MKHAKTIIDFWVEVGPEKWYTQSDAVDAEIAERFKDLRDQAARGELDEWQNSAEGALALLLLLDQFSRNLYRGDAESFAADAHAREIARDAIDAGFDRQFDPALRQFFYLPFCHSEALSDHDWLVEVAPEADLQGNMADFEAHREIIQDFGRFPFRNAALGRENTPEEDQFMADGGYSPIRQKWVEKLQA